MLPTRVFKHRIAENEQATAEKQGAAQAILEDYQALQRSDADKTRLIEELQQRALHADEIASRDQTIADQVPVCITRPAPAPRRQSRKPGRLSRDRRQAR